MIKVPTIKSEYLSFGEGATMEKILTIKDLINFVGGTEPENVKVTILEWGNKLERNLKDFTPNYVSSNDYTTIEYIDNLLYTMELNPPEEVILTLPNGKELYVTDKSEYDDLLDDCYDVINKIQDIADTLRSGNKLDSTQDAFLRMHNIIE